MLTNMQKRGKFLIYCWWEYQSVQPLWKTAWKGLNKLKMELPCNVAIPLLSTYPKEMKLAHQKTAACP